MVQVLNARPTFGSRFSETFQPAFQQGLSRFLENEADIAKEQRKLEAQQQADQQLFAQLGLAPASTEGSATSTPRNRLLGQEEVARSEEQQRKPFNAGNLSPEQIIGAGIRKPALGSLLQKMNEAERRESREERKEKREERIEKKEDVEKAYKAQENFINETTSSYRAFETDFKPRLLQLQKMASDDDLVSPTAAVFLEHLGIPLGALDDPTSELYNKVSQDLLKGLPESYGNRILKVEVDNFLKTIPQLINSPAGRRMIASNMLKLGEMKEVYYNEMRKLQSGYLEQDEPLPKDFQQRVFDQVKPQIDRINNDFQKLTEIKDVPEDTIPFFNPGGEIEFVPKDLEQWAIDNGGRRIW